MVTEERVCWTRRCPGHVTSANSLPNESEMMMSLFPLLVSDPSGEGRVCCQVLGQRYCGDSSGCQSTHAGAGNSRMIQLIQSSSDTFPRFRPMGSSRVTTSTALTILSSQESVTDTFVRSSPAPCDPRSGPVKVSLQFPTTSFDLTSGGVHALYPDCDGCFWKQ